jgi:hypothetical protein
MRVSQGYHERSGLATWEKSAAGQWEKQKKSGNEDPRVSIGRQAYLYDRVLK